MGKKEHPFSKILKKIPYAEFFRKEPVASISLVFTLIIGILGGPIFYDWYSKPKLIAEVYITKDKRCCSWKIAVENRGRRAAKNVLITYDIDYFTARGDIRGFYSGEEPFYRIVRKVSFYTEPRQIKIPALPPGIRQEFLYIEEIIDSDAFSKRQKLIAQGDKTVVGYPRVTILTSDDGLGKLIYKDIHPPLIP